jgi:hypothetical protein
VFQANFPSQVSDAVHDVIPLSVDNLCNVIQFPFNLLELLPDLVDLAIFCLQLLLLIGKVLFQLAFVHFRANKLLLELGLISTALFQFGCGFDKFLFLPQSLVHVFVALQNLLFHVFDFLQEFLLLGFFFLLVLILLLKFRQ